MSLDIPYFYAKSDQTDLFNDFGVVASNYFQKSSLAVVEDKIEHMGPDDLKRQITFIQLLLTDMNDHHSPYRSEYTLSQVSKDFDKKQVSRQLAEKTFNKLIDNMAVSPDGSSVCWLSMTVIGSEKNPGWQIRPLGPYLYDGYAGLDIFLWAYHVTTGNDHARQVAVLVDNELFRYTDDIVTAKLPGIETEEDGLTIVPDFFGNFYFHKKSSVCLGTSFSAVGFDGSWITLPCASSSRITSRSICLKVSRCSSARIARTRKSLRWFAGICCR